MMPSHIGTELVREFATILMLAAVGVIAGRRGWRSFAYFLVAFGFWDIFYYVWLKVLLDWPASVTDWDILFLIPLPWIGPVIAPVLISLLMIVCGWLMVTRLFRDEYFHPRWISWAAGLLGTVAALASFMIDADATLRGQTPRPYHYELLALSLLLYVAGVVLACRHPVRIAHSQR
jgi:hypothetical protein